MGHLADAFFHFLAGLERHYVLLRHIDAVVGSGVARAPRLASTDLEYAEITQLYSTIFDERVDDGVKRPLDDFLRFQLRQIGAIGNPPDYLFLGHG